MMELSVKIAKKPSTIFAKTSITDAWQGTKYASANNIQIWSILSTSWKYELVTIDP